MLSLLGGTGTDLRITMRADSAKRVSLNDGIVNIPSNNSVTLILSLELVSMNGRPRALAQILPSSKLTSRFSIRSHFVAKEKDNRHFVLFKQNCTN